MPEGVDLLLVTASAEIADTWTEAIKSLRPPRIARAIPVGDEVIEILSCSGRHAELVESDRPKAVVIDLTRDEESAMNLLRRVKSCTQMRPIPVIAIVSAQMPALLANAYEAGVNSVMTRPASREDFTEQIKLLAKYWLEFNQSVG